MLLKNMRDPNEDSLSGILDLPGRPYYHYEVSEVPWPFTPFGKKLDAEIKRRGYCFNHGGICMHDDPDFPTGTLDILRDYKSNFGAEGGCDIWTFRSISAMVSNLDPTSNAKDLVTAFKNTSLGDEGVYFESRRGMMHMSTFYDQSGPCFKIDSYRKPAIDQGLVDSLIKDFNLKLRRTRYDPDPQHGDSFEAELSGYPSAAFHIASRIFDIYHSKMVELSKQREITWEEFQKFMNTKDYPEDVKLPINPMGE